MKVTTGELQLLAQVSTLREYFIHLYYIHPKSIKHAPRPHTMVAHFRPRKYK